MMTSLNGNIFRVTGHLCGEFTGHLRLYKRLGKHSWGWWFETLSRPLWRHRNMLISLGRNTIVSTNQTCIYVEKYVLLVY